MRNVQKVIDGIQTRKQDNEIKSTWNNGQFHMIDRGSLGEGVESELRQD